MKRGLSKRHGCPSHGIGLTPDETELWLSDAFNQQMHIFKLNGDTPPVQIKYWLRDQPGWITFTRTGDYAYPATGEVIDVKTKRYY
ncbi:MAG: hypothetical protein IPF93_00020 [Saprospiraceae bacterium]|nr:hypothetical protein [Saprospiraceae bacterium]